MSAQPAYLVSVCGANAPTKLHPTLDEAKAEAHRLSCDTRNRDRTIYVLQLAAIYKPQSQHVWEAVGEAA
jgi:hypothetical protein